MVNLASIIQSWLLSNSRYLFKSSHFKIKCFSVTILSSSIYFYQIHKTLTGLLTVWLLILTLLNKICEVPFRSISKNKSYNVNIACLLTLYSNKSGWMHSSAITIPFELASFIDSRTISFVSYFFMFISIRCLMDAKNIYLMLY